MTIYNQQVAKVITETGKVTLVELIARLKERGVEL
jgi:hypothetical protein